MGCQSARHLDLLEAEHSFVFADNVVVVGDLFALPRVRQDGIWRHITANELLECEGSGVDEPHRTTDHSDVEM